MGVGNTNYHWSSWAVAVQGMQGLGTIELVVFDQQHVLVIAAQLLLVMLSSLGWGVVILLPATGQPFDGKPLLACVLKLQGHLGSVG